MHFLTLASGFDTGGHCFFRPGGRVVTMTAEMLSILVTEAEYRRHFVALSAYYNIGPTKFK